VTSPPFGSSTRTAGVDPRYDSLSRAYRIIVRPTKAEEPSGFHFPVTHVFGLFCNASAKYAQGTPSLAHTRGTPIFRAALVQTGLRPPSTSFRVGEPHLLHLPPLLAWAWPRRVCEQTQQGHSKTEESPKMNTNATTNETSNVTSLPTAPKPQTSKEVTRRRGQRIGASFVFYRKVRPCRGHYTKRKKSYANTSWVELTVSTCPKWRLFGFIVPNVVLIESYRCSRLLENAEARGSPASPDVASEGLCPRP